MEVHAPSKGGPLGGTCTIAGNTELELFGASTANIAFSKDSTVFRFDDSSQFAGTVAGFAYGDCIDLADIGFGANTTLGYTPHFGDIRGTLTIACGEHNANIALLGQSAASDFVMASDCHGGTPITDPRTLATQTRLTEPHA